MLFSEKYSPKKIDEVAGNDTAKEEVKKWALEAERGKPSKPLLLHGPVGIGKTALAYATAMEMNWSVIETNASDLRDAENMNRIYGMGAASNGLFGEKRLILVDEIDSVNDRQEFSSLQKFLLESKQPVMLIANDVWNQRLSTIRFSCKMIEMRKVNSATIRKILEKIASAEGMSVNPESFGEIAELSKGDLRAAINDLQASGGNKELVMDRDREKGIFDQVKTVFKSENYKGATDAGQNLDTQDFDMLSKWLGENIPAEYEKLEEQTEAFSWLSRADIFQGRIFRRQNYSYLKYARALSLAGVALSKKKPYYKFVKYSFPSSIRKLGASRKNRGLLKSISSKIASDLHCSPQQGRESLSFLAGVEGMPERFSFSEDESSFVLSEFCKNENKKNGKAKDKR